MSFGDRRRLEERRRAAEDRKRAAGGHRAADEVERATEDGEAAAHDRGRAAGQAPADALGAAGRPAGAEGREERNAGGPGHGGQRGQGAKHRGRVEERELADEERPARDEGLSSVEARRRLEEHGPNEVEEEERHLVRELLSHFWGPIPWMIESVAVLTAVTGRWIDLGIIIVLLVINGGVGFWEEHQATGALEALKERLARRARVKRDGEWQEIDARELVPGDLAFVEMGDVIPADAEIQDGAGEFDESALTGESLPAGKEAGEVIFSGASVSRGRVEARVVATGAQTEFGATAALVGEERASHFQKAVLRIGKYLIILALALIAVIVVVSLLRGEDALTVVEFALVVAIASIPVALPAVLSVTLAVGSRVLSKHEAIVQRLPAIEEMAGVEVLFADKTGTITRNELAVQEAATLDEGRDDSGVVLMTAALAAEHDSGDPVDRAILAAVDEHALDGYEVVDFRPFDSDRKRAEARVRGPEGEVQAAKGATQAVLDLAGADEDVRRRVDEIASRFAEHGYRALAVARADAGAWRVAGLLALSDPPREDAAEMIRGAAALGVRVKMVTGDRVEIGREIAREVGIGEDIREADTLPPEVTGDEDAERVAAAVEEADGFAQVRPRHKYELVRAVQERRGAIVGMTGDGVNDAPALSRADAGIAVAGATDAARSAAEITLLTPGIGTIVEAIRESRRIFRRMTNYAIYRITETIRVVVFVTAAILALSFFPVTPIQIILLAVLNDAAILSIAYDRARPSEQVARWDMREVMTIAGVLGLAGVLSSFGILFIGQAFGLSEDEVRTLVYLKLSVAGHLTVFVARTRGPLWEVRPSGILFTAVVGTQIIATLIAVYGFLMEPLGWGLAGLAWGYGLVWMLALDRAKLLTYGSLARRGERKRAAAAA